MEGSFDMIRKSIVKLTTGVLTVILLLSTMVGCNSKSDVAYKESDTSLQADNQFYMFGEIQDVKPDYYYVKIFGNSYLSSEADGSYYATIPKKGTEYVVGTDIKIGYLNSVSFTGDGQSTIFYTDGTSVCKNMDRMPAALDEKPGIYNVVYNRIISIEKRDGQNNYPVKVGGIFNLYENGTNQEQTDTLVQFKSADTHVLLLFSMKTSDIKNRPVSMGIGTSAVLTCQISDMQVVDLQF